MRLQTPQAFVPDVAATAPFSSNIPSTLSRIGQVKGGALIGALFVGSLAIGCAEPSAEQSIAEIGQNAVVSVANDWYWIDVAAMGCRDGSETGIGLRIDPIGDGLLVFLQGGGGCWDDVSCAANLIGLGGDSYGSDRFSGWAQVLGGQGVFNRDHPENPYRNFHHVYVPYCTGDFHAGTRQSVDVPGGPKNQQFVGSANIDAVVDMLRPSLETQSEIVVAGSSAGSFGVALNYGKFAAAAAPTPVTMIADGGPFLPFMPACFQNAVRELFGLEIPPSCAGCSVPAAGGLSNLYAHWVSEFPTGHYGVDSALFDSALIPLFDRESVLCGDEPVISLTFLIWMVHLRDAVLAPTAAISTFLWAGGEHTMLQFDDRFYSTGTAATGTAGVRPVDWVSGLSGAVVHVQP